MLTMRGMINKHNLDPNRSMSCFCGIFWNHRVLSASNPCIYFMFFNSLDYHSPHERGTNKKFWVPMSNPTSDLWIPSSDVLPLSYRDSMVSEVHNKVHIWHTSCIMLGSAMLIASWNASKRGVRRSEVRFLMGTQNFFFVPRSRQHENTSVSISELKTYHISYSIYNHSSCFSDVIFCHILTVSCKQRHPVHIVDT